VNFFLDTNICIYFLKGTYSALLDNLYSHAASEIKIASIVKAELLYGAAHSKKVVDNTEKVERFLLPYETIAFDSSAAEHYAQIRAKLAKKGTPIGPNDLIIAATALANNGILVTNKEQEFSRINELPLENWTV